jgi:hypothetical protein
MGLNKTMDLNDESVKVSLSVKARTEYESRVSLRFITDGRTEGMDGLQ